MMKRSPKESLSDGRNHRGVSDLTADRKGKNSHEGPEMKAPPLTLGLGRRSISLCGKIGELYHLPQRENTNLLAGTRPRRGESVRYVMPAPQSSDEQIQALCTPSQPGRWGPSGSAIRDEPGKGSRPPGKGGIFINGSGGVERRMKKYIDGEFYFETNLELVKADVGLAVRDAVNEFCGQIEVEYVDDLSSAYVRGTEEWEARQSVPGVSIFVNSRSDAAVNFDYIHIIDASLRDILLVVDVELFDESEAQILNARADALQIIVDELREMVSSARPATAITGRRQ